jgi:hypothetical protein
MRETTAIRLATVLAAALFASCSTLSTGVGYVTGSTQQKQQEEKVARLQADVMSFADVYVGEVIDASSRIPAATQEDRIRQLSFQVRQATAVYEIASGENPAANLLDMVVLVTATRSAVGSRWFQESFGESGKPILDVLVRREGQIWDIARHLLDADQEQKLRKYIEGWLARNPDVQDVSALRLADMGSVPGSKAGGLGTPTDVLKSMGLDLFGGIDPAVAEVQRSRMLAERAFYFAKRWPRLLEMQTRLLGLQLAAQPAPAQVLADVSRVSLAAESVARTAEGLPALVDREREAAIRQFLDALSSQEARARKLLVEMRRTLDAGTGAAKAVHGALGSLDAILATTSEPGPPGTPPSRPFDVTEYTRALEQLGRSATELEALLRTVNQDAPRVAALIGDAGREVSDRGRALVDYAFGRALTLVLVAVLSTLAAALLYRWASLRMSRT